MDDEADLTDAMWAEAELEERHRREDELLRQHAVILKLFRQEQAQYEREMGNERGAQWWERRAS